jgi:uncharacterized protein (TIGR03437 family)
VRVLSFLLLAILSIAHSVAGPLSFEQRNPGHFMARLPGGTVEFRPDRVTAGGVTLRFLHASSDAHMEGVGAAAPSTYLGHGFSRTFPQFPKLAIRNLYPGIEAIFYGNGQNLEYDLEVAPGVSPEKIRISVEGAKVQIDDGGNLKMDSAKGVFWQMLPRVLQSNRPIEATYVLAHSEIGFRVAKHDARLPLTIDPLLEFANTFGGSGTSSASSVATDAQGNIYVAGLSNSSDFPTTANGYETHLAPPLVALSNAGQTITPLPVGPEENVVAVGGTPDGKALYAATPGGIYISVDGGAMWPAKAALPSLPAGASGPLNINSISVNTLDSSRFCVATNFGLFFRCSNIGLPVGGAGFVSAQSVIITPGAGNVLYATSGGHVYKSIDTGATWQQLNPTYPGEPAIPPIRYANTLAALGPNGNDLYVIDGSATLFKSTDQGTTWQVLDQQLYQATILAIDPSNPANIFYLNTAGLHRSEDGGATFSLIAPFANPDGSAIVSVALDSSGTLYVGRQNAIYVSTDHGTTVTQLQHLPVSATLLGAIGDRAYVGTQVGQAAFVIKYDPTGSRILYSTFLGEGDVSLGGLTVDPLGEAVLAGFTDDPDFPATIPALSPPAPGKNDVFVLKLNADGAKLVYSRLFGGSRYLPAPALTADSTGAVYLTGNTSAPDFPTTSNAFQPAFPTAPCTRTTSIFYGNQNLGTHTFVTKLSPDGSSLIYSTFLTGACGSIGTGIKVDASGQAVIVGYTTAPDFPVSANSYQPAFPGPSDQPSPPGLLNAGFVAKLSAAGDKLLAGSFIGGGYQTIANAAALDSSGNVYITGGTQGIAPGATPGAFQPKLIDTCAPMIGIGGIGPPPTGTGDAFLLKLDPTLSTARYMTYLGGGCADAGTSIALDATGNAWITGQTASPDFPLRAPFQDATTPTLNSGFVSEMNADGSQLLFSSMTDGIALGLDTAGNAYVAGARGRSALLQKIDASSAPSVIVDSIQPVVAFPSLFVAPYGKQFAPGQLMQLSGRNLGPATRTNAELDQFNRLPFSLANTIVYFDDIPAPLISVQANSITGFAPFEIGASTQISVVFNGQRSNMVRNSVASIAPQILSIANQNGTQNSANSPAKLGSVVALYVTGLGVTNPLSADGLVNLFPLPVPARLPGIFLGQTQVQPLYAGAAPGLISGINQVNLQLPATISPPSNQIAIGIGSANASIFIAQ